MSSRVEGLHGKERGETGRRNTPAFTEANPLSKQRLIGSAGNPEREEHFLSLTSGWGVACEEKEV